MGGDRPDEPDQLAGGGGGDDRSALAALLLEPTPDVVQALLGFPGDRDYRCFLVLLAALEHGPDPGWAAGRGTTSARCPCGSFSDAALPNPA